MTQALRIAGIVVLYNPPADFIDNVQRYLNAIDRLYVVDNSETDAQPRAAQFSNSPKIRYISNGRNLGIARALNQGAERALNDGFDLLLTMDQDSLVTPGMIRTMLLCLEKNDLSEIGILSPVQVFVTHQNRPIDIACEDILTTMTSGNLLNLKAYQSVGPFLDKLFIDYVDYEYCMRLRLHGFRVLRANNATLYHKLGSITEYRLPFKQFALGNHPPIRRYYITRNKFYLYRNYRRYFPEFFRPFFKLLFYEIVTILLLEDDKLKKLKMILRGYLDYKKGIYGKFPTQG